MTNPCMAIIACRLIAGSKPNTVEATASVFEERSELLSGERQGDRNPPQEPTQEVGQAPGKRPVATTAAHLAEQGKGPKDNEDTV